MESGLNIYFLVLSLLGNAAQFVFNRYERVYMAWKKFSFWVFNTTTCWNVSMSFDIESKTSAEVDDLLNNIMSFLRRGGSVNVYRNYARNKAIQVNGIMYEIMADDTTLSIQINDQKVGYRDSKKLLEKEILKVIELIENNINFRAAHYTLVAKFNESKNPYLGLFIQRESRYKIKTFQCTLDCDDSVHRNSVTINLDSITVFAESKEEFRKLSYNYIALSGI